MQFVSTLRVAGLAALAGLVVALVGCKLIRPPERPVPLPPGANADDLVDAGASPEDATDLFEEARKDDTLEALGQKIQKQKIDALARVEKDTGVEYKRYNTLLISGGAVYGAYCAGVLAGWSAYGKKPEDGGRPAFDVVTGISTGALIAPYAFLGSDYDDELRRQYTTLSDKDVFTIRRTVRGILAESAADNAPLRHRLEQAVTYQLMSRVAEEHAKGRRLYVGSTNLDTKRLIVWDIGAIATRGTPADRQLIIDVLLASSALPAFFPSVRFNVDIEGQRYEELHVDGGVTRALFYRNPYMKPSRRAETPNPDVLAGSNVYVLVAGKMFADPEGVRPRTVAVAGSSISGLLYAETRAELYRIYTLCVLTGMNFWVSAIPPELPVTKKSTSFDRGEMTKMFEEGYKRGQGGAFSRGAKDVLKAGPAWDTVPPGLRTSDLGRTRSGLQLKVDKPVPDKPAAPPTNPAPEGKP